MESGDRSDALMKKLGYKADLQRTLDFFSNFGIAFCYISPVVGVYSLFGYGLSTAGPAFVWRNGHRPALGIQIILASQHSSATLGSASESFTSARFRSSSPRTPRGFPFFTTSTGL